MPADFRHGLLCAALLCAGAMARPQSAPAYQDASASDPVRLGWMVGAPPPPDRIIAFQDGSYYRFPQLRWSFSHWRELTPTINVSRGPRPAHALPRALRNDIDAITFTPLGGAPAMTWELSLAAIRMAMPWAREVSTWDCATWRASAK